MVKIEEIIIRLSEAGVQVYLEDGKLKTKSLKQSMTAELTSIIRSNKDQVIAYLTSSGINSLQGRETAAIKPVPRDSNSIFLSFAQERLWFIDRLEGGSPEYNMPTTLPISGEFNIDAAEQAFNRIIQRHEPLRTVFAETEDGPIQIIQEDVTFKLARYDLSNLNKKKQAARANDLTTTV